MGAFGWTIILAAFAAIGSFAGLSASNQHPDIARSAYLAFSSKMPPAPASGSDIAFRQQGACSIPVIDERLVFRGGLTSGEQISVRMDTALNTYRFRIEAARDADRRAHVRSGTLSLDQSDCSFALSGDQNVRVAINRDGVLFGSIDNGGAVPIRMIAFSSVSSRLADLTGDWRIVGGGKVAAGNDGLSLAREAKIRPDGTYSRCSLTHASPLHCIPNTGRIALSDYTFTTIESDGHRGELILGKAGNRLVPVLLRPDAGEDGLHFLVPQSGSNTTAIPGGSEASPSRQHAQVVSPVFHR